MVLLDKLGRPLASLRLSVTDRCNLRCEYCMPEQEYVWLPRERLLKFEEIGALVDVFTSLGVRRLRLTGGEPLLRRDLSELVRMLACKPAIEDLALTTNGLLLAERASELRAAGLHRVTVSLDTLRPDVFQELTRRDGLAQVLEGIDAARRAGFGGLKLDTVVMRGVNDGELGSLVEYARSIGAELRFIEYMDVGGATKWSLEQVVSREEILASLRSRFGAVEPLGARDSAPAERFALSDGTVIGIIASTTAPFCRSCDRSRLTADGQWYLCLYARIGVDLRQALRAGESPEQLGERIARAWTGRTDRGAEERALVDERRPLAGAGTLRGDPHLEMHTRGG